MNALVLTLDIDEWEKVAENEKKIMWLGHFIKHKHCLSEKRVLPRYIIL